MEFLENRRSWENQKPPENRQKSGLFWASPFTMHLVCTLLIISRTIGPVPHRVSRALRAQNPGRVRKKSGKSMPGPGRPQKCRKSAQKSPKRFRNSGFRLFSDSFETPGRTLSELLGPCPGVLFPDSFRTLPRFRARRARETLWGAGPIATSAELWHFRWNGLCEEGQRGLFVLES